MLDVTHALTLRSLDMTKGTLSYVPENKLI